MAYKVISSPKVEKDIETAIKFYADIQKSLAKRFLSELKSTLKNIPTRPYHYQIRYASVRLAHLKTFPYSIHFVIDKKSIIILAVFHMAMDSENWKSNS